MRLASELQTAGDMSARQLSVRQRSGVVRFSTEKPALSIHRWLLGYGIGAVCVAVALGIRFALAPMLGNQSPFMVFAPAALLAARFGGLGPGLAALVAGLVLGDYYFTPPYHSWGPYGLTEITLMLTYGITTFVAVFLFHLLRRSKAQLQAAAELAWQHGQELEREVAERTQAEMAVQKAKDQLSAYAGQLENRVTERTAKLQDSVRSLELVLYHVAHDLRAPLRAMQGFPAMLIEQCGAALDTGAEEYARRIMDAAYRMDDLLHDLLEYGRVCHVDLIRTKLCLAEVVTRVNKQCAGSIQERNASIEMPSSLPKVWADGQLLAEALICLLDNALKFVPPERVPRLRWWAELQGDTVRLWLEDNGIGIEPQYRERVFRVFERLQPGRNIPGNGIGLAIAQKALQRMNGDVGFKSVPAEGSQFWIELPKA